MRPRPRKRQRMRHRQVCCRFPLRKVVLCVLVVLKSFARHQGHETFLHRGHRVHGEVFPAENSFTSLARSLTVKKFSTFRFCSPLTSADHALEYPPLKRNVVHSLASPTNERQSYGETSLPWEFNFSIGGKVRDLYEVGNRLLIVATDRLSAFDVVLPTPIPDKGRVLTQISLFWFDLLRYVIPKHVVTATDFPPELAAFRAQLDGRRSMLCRKTNLAADRVRRARLPLLARVGRTIAPPAKSAVFRYRRGLPQNPSGCRMPFSPRRQRPRPDMTRTFRLTMQLRALAASSPSAFAP